MILLFVLGLWVIKQRPRKYHKWVIPIKTGYVGMYFRGWKTQKARPRKEVLVER